MLHYNWLDEAHKAGTVKVLQDAAALATLRDTEVQRQISVLKTPQFWSYVGSSARWRNSFEGEKDMDTGKNKEKEHIGQNERIGHCIFVNEFEHTCTKFCNMNAEGSLGRKRVEQLLVKRLNKNAKMPVRGTVGSAGYDLSSADNVVIPGKSRAVVKTGLAIAIPSGTYATIAPRSGLAVKRSIDVGAGVVDADYRGEVGVVLINNSDDEFRVQQGDRIAQLLLEKIATPAVEEVEALDDTVRGAGGFGSTGMQPSPVDQVNPGTSSTDQDQDAQTKSKMQSVRVKIVKRLEGSNKPHVLNQTTATRQRSFVSVKAIKKLAKAD